MFGIERFQQYLWGRTFAVVTNHKPLLGLLGPDMAVPMHASPRVLCCTFRLADYSYRLVDRPGNGLAPADALSRLPLPELPAAVPEPAQVLILEHAYPEVQPRAAVSQVTSHDPVVPQVVKAVPRRESLAERTDTKKAAEPSLQQGCLLFLQWVHVGHPGVEKTKMVARYEVYCPALGQEITHVVQSCQVCQENKRSSHLVTSLWLFKERPWSRLHVDFGEPFTSHYFLLVVDDFFKHPFGKPAGRGANYACRCQQSTRGWRYWQHCCTTRK
ncbi:uncharacterized protein LOC144160709 [Haemaphysalis longicornis]